MQSPDTLVADLIGLEPIKTWSLIVTIFGDLEGDTLTGKQLRALLEPIGVKPEATRVALHRLKNDGWITSYKSGREVTYALSASGLAETNSVSHDIYRQDKKYTDGWRILVTDDGAYNDIALKITRSLLLVPKETDISTLNVMGIDPALGCLPSWVEARIVGDEILTLAQRLAPLAQRAISEGATNGVNFVRILLLHRWRKMALKPECWAHIHLLPNGPLAACHDNISLFLAQTSRIQVADI